MDLECIDMFRRFEGNLKFREVSLVWFIHLMKDTTVSINHILKLVHDLYNMDASFEFTFER
jgi:hypothetical protein